MILFCVFSREISDTDFWWQLKTGEYITQTHSLPDPDPFAYTTAGAGEAYDGEADDGAVSRIGGCYEAAAS